MGKFASQTNVPVEKSRAEIETVLARYGATHFAYSVGPDAAMIAFATKDRHVRFKLPLPNREERRFHFTAARGQSRGELGTGVPATLASIALGHQGEARSGRLWHQHV